MYELLVQVSSRYIRAKIYIRKYLIIFFFLQYFMYLLLVMIRNLPR